MKTESHKLRRCHEVKSDLDRRVYPCAGWPCFRWITGTCILTVELGVQRSHTRLNVVDKYQVRPFCHNWHHSNTNITSGANRGHGRFGNSGGTLSIRIPWKVWGFDYPLVKLARLALFWLMYRAKAPWYPAMGISIYWHLVKEKRACYLWDTRMQLSFSVNSRGYILMVSTNQGKWNSWTLLNIVWNRGPYSKVCITPLLINTLRKAMRHG